MKLLLLTVMEMSVTTSAWMQWLAPVGVVLDMSWMPMESHAMVNIDCFVSFCLR